MATFRKEEFALELPRWEFPVAEQPMLRQLLGVPGNSHGDLVRQVSHSNERNRQWQFYESGGLSPEKAPW
ncbi:MAG: hypothetical protein ACK43N_19450, partial [Pirellulaceae bacterium]